MRKKSTFLLLCYLAVCTSIFSQNVTDAVVPLAVTVDESIPTVTLSWTNTAPVADTLLILRRQKDDDVWYIFAEGGNTNVTSFTDSEVQTGETYEYLVWRGTNNINAFGYAAVPVLAPLTEARGRFLLFVEKDLESALSTEINRLVEDLTGDGWQVVRHSVEANATIQSVKSQIKSDYNANPGSVQQVFLLGNIPVPYSGNTNWDGHPEHQGAWPADLWYGDVINDNLWTDQTVNTANNSTPPNRAETVNVPGDGKFDQSLAPSPVEIAVGRVDFSNLSETTFGTSRTELYRRYLDKNHKWRTKQYVVDDQALVDDNFGYFNGEAFAANGYRNANMLVGVSNVKAGDFFNDTDTQSFLMGYGCGGGTYTSASGVGNSNNFATDSVNIAFSMLFGSYHGDWDYSPNPFMPSALASKGGILSCAWAGRPHWFFHPMGAGESLGYCARNTQNVFYIDGYVLYAGARGAHVSLLGDPSLRAQVVAPATNLAAAQKCNSVLLEWEPSAASNLLGYHVYRASKMNEPFERLTTDLLTENTFLDAAPLTGDQVYQVRAVVREQTPSGSFLNGSTGIFTNFQFTPTSPPQVSTTNGVITCNADATLSANTNAAQPTYVWYFNGAVQSQDATLTTNISGSYQVVVTDASTGCSTTASASAFVNQTPPPADLGPDRTLTCSQPTYTLWWNNGQYLCAISHNGNVLPPPVVIQQPGAYTVTVTDPSNGCTATDVLMIFQNTTPPDIEPLPQTVELNCVADLYSGPCRPPYLCDFFTANGVLLPTPDITQGGAYRRRVTDPANGCTIEQDFVVTENFTPPPADAGDDLVLTCAQPVAALPCPPQYPDCEWLNPDGIVIPNPAAATTGGVYTLTVTDPANGCKGSDDLLVTLDNSLPVANAGPDLTLTCLQTSFVLECPAEYPDCTWTGPNGTAPGPLSVNQPGIYTLTVVNTATNCTASDAMVISEDVAVPSLSVSGDLTSDCFQQLPVMASATPANATIVWSGPGIQSPNDASQNLTPNESYTVIATNPANGCTASQDLSPQTPPQLQILNIILAIDCEGVISSWAPSVTGGVPPYGFSLNPPLPLPQNTAFTATIQDANGCIITETGTTPASPTLPLSATATSTDESLFGVHDGTVTAEPVNGVLPYSFSWSNGGTSATISDLAPGAYTCTVTDAAGCTVVVSAVVNEGSLALENIDRLQRLEVFPNPSSGMFAVHISLEKAANLQIEIMDATGRNIAFSSSFFGTDKSWQLDLGSRPAGVYFCKIRVDEKIVTRRLVKLE